MEYGFNVEIAQKLGVNEAIIIRNFQYWLQKNKANNANFYEGRFWTYNSIAAFCKIFPFWTERQIRNILKNLTDSKILIKGNFNKNPYDKTIWYSIDEDVLNMLISDNNEFLSDKKSDDPIQNQSESTETVDLTNLSHRFDKSVTSICQNGHIDLTNQAHRCDQNVKPIPCVNTDSKPCENTHTNVCACENFNLEKAVEDFCEDYEAIKGGEGLTQKERDEVSKVLALEKGYNKNFWQTVFKKSLGGWQINENGAVRMVPCGLKSILENYGEIFRDEKGLKKVAAVSRTKPETKVCEPPESFAQSEAGRISARAKIDWQAFYSKSS